MMKKERNDEKRKKERRDERKKERKKERSDKRKCYGTYLTDNNELFLLL